MIDMRHLMIIMFSTEPFRSNHLFIQYQFIQQILRIITVIRLHMALFHQKSLLWNLRLQMELFHQKNLLLSLLHHMVPSQLTKIPSIFNMELITVAVNHQLQLLIHIIVIGQVRMHTQILHTDLLNKFMNTLHQVMYTMITYTNTLHTLMTNIHHRMITTTNPHIIHLSLNMLLPRQLMLPSSS